MNTKRNKLSVSQRMTFLGPVGKQGSTKSPPWQARMGVRHG